LLILRRRQTRVQPTFPAAVHGFDVGVAHFRRLSATSAERKPPPQYRMTLAFVSGTRCSISRSMMPLPRCTAPEDGLWPFIVFAHIHQKKFLPASIRRFTSPTLFPSLSFSLH